MTHHGARGARGFSIVELMVAITLALIVTAGVMAAFLGSRSSFMTTSGTSAVSDNGRFALDFLQAPYAARATWRAIRLIASCLY